MQAELVKTFRFEAAHSLTDLPEGHKCRRMHGHSYRVDVHVAGPVGDQTGMVMDFGDLASAVRPLLETLDHQVLNDVPGLGSPTSERIAAYLWHHLRPDLPGLKAVVVWESDTSRCIYRGQ